jgi:hypothetical protein
MPSVSDWKVPSSAQPKPEDYSYDLEQALACVVGLRATVPADAFTADTLGTERAGNGVIIRGNGLVLTIGYLITEADTVWLNLSDGRSVPGHVLGYDQETGFGLVQALAKLDMPALEIGNPRRPRSASASCRRRRRAPSLGRRAHRRQAGIRRLLGICARRGDLHRAGASELGRHGADRTGRRSLGIGSLQLQHAVDKGQTQNINMIVPIDLLKPIIDDLLKFGRRNAAAAVARPLRDRGGEPAGRRRPRRSRTGQARRLCAPATSCCRSPARTSATSPASSAASGRKARPASKCRSRSIATARPWICASSRASATASSRARVCIEFRSATSRTIFLQTARVKPQPLSISRIAQRHAKLALELVVPHAPAFLPKTQRHRRHRRRRVGERDFRRRRRGPISCAAKAIGSPGGAGSSSATLKMPSARRAKAASIACAMSPTWMRLKTCPGLTMRRALPRAIWTARSVRARKCRRAAGWRRRCRGARRVFARRARRQAARGRAPSPAAAAFPRRPRRRHGRHRRRPSTDRRSSAAGRLRQGVAECGEHGIAGRAGRNRDERQIGFGDRAVEFSRRCRAVEDQRLEPSGRHTHSKPRRVRRRARCQRCARTVAERCR